MTEHRTRIVLVKADWLSNNHHGQDDPLRHTPNHSPNHTLPHIWPGTAWSGCEIGRAVTTQLLSGVLPAIQLHTRLSRNVDEFNSGVPGSHRRRRTLRVCSKLISKVRQGDSIQHHAFDVAVLNSQPFDQIRGDDGHPLRSLLWSASAVPRSIEHHVHQMPIGRRHAIPPSLGNRDRYLGQELLRRNRATPTAGTHQARPSQRR